MALSGTINGTVSNKSTYFSFYITWSATQSISNNYSDVTTKTYWKTTNTAWTWNTVSTRSAWVEINGNRYSWSQVFDCDPWSLNPYCINTRTVRVNHNTDGTKSINISAYADGTASTYGPNGSNASGTITLNAIPRTPTAPTACTAIGRDTASYDSGSTITITWSGATGYITGYDLDYRVCDKDTGVWGTWISWQSDSAASPTSHSWSYLSNTKYQYRVRTCNGTLKSAYKESNILIHRGAMGITVSSVFKFATPHVRVAGVWRKAKKVYVKVAGVWTESK